MECAHVGNLELDFRLPRHPVAFVLKPSAFSRCPLPLV
jgi:hypothetical protein